MLQTIIVCNLICEEVPHIKYYFEHIILYFESYFEFKFQNSQSVKYLINAFKSTYGDVFGC